MPTYEYKDWLVAMGTALRTARPDVKPEHIDPNASFAAFQAGTSSHVFVRQAILPLRPPPPVPQAAPAPQAIPRRRSALSGINPALAAFLLVAVALVAILASQGGSDRPSAERASSALLDAFQSRGFHAVAQEYPGVSWLLQDLSGKDGTGVDGIESSRIVEVDVHPATESEKVYTDFPGDIARVRADVHARMEDGNAVRGTLTLYYVPLLKEFKTAIFSEDDSR